MANADQITEVGSMTLDAGWCRSDQVPDKSVDSWAPGDLFGRRLLGGAQRQQSLFMLAPLQEGAGGIDEEARLALSDRDLAEVNGAGDIQRDSRVAQGHGDVDPVQLGVGGAERRPAEVTVLAHAAADIVGFAEKFMCCAAVVVPGSGY